MKRGFWLLGLYFGFLGLLMWEDFGKEKNY
jgi:hypothetical protein